MERPSDKDDKRRGDAERRFCEIGVVDPFDTFQLASLHPFSYSIACLYTQLARGLPCLSLSPPVCHSSKQYSFHSSRLTFCLLKIGFLINVRQIHCRSQVIKYLMILKLLLSSRHTCFIVRLF